VYGDGLFIARNNVDVGIFFTVPLKYKVYSADLI
jgi:hypothetical protein